jgi:hypothetical protein
MTFGDWLQVVNLMAVAGVPLIIFLHRANTARNAKIQHDITELVKQSRSMKMRVKHLERHACPHYNTKACKRHNRQSQPTERTKE